MKKDRDWSCPVIGSNTPTKHYSAVNGLPDSEMSANEDSQTLQTIVNAY